MVIASPILIRLEFEDNDIVGILDIQVSSDPPHDTDDGCEAYLEEIARILEPEGGGFIHQSKRMSVLSQGIAVDDTAGRTEDMFAERFLHLAVSAGLRIIGQEIIARSAVGEMGCISTFVSKGSPWDQPARIIKNPQIIQEAMRVKELSKLYPPYYTRLRSALGRMFHLAREAFSRKAPRQPITSGLAGIESRRT